MINMPTWPKVLLNKASISDGLYHAQAVLQALGNPHKKLPPVIHIAGTNGKGSTQAMLKSIFECAGYKVHTYISPHFCSFNERIYLAGEYISDYHLIEVLRETKMASESINVEPGFLAGVTIASFLAFSQVKADVLILETGLGGRYDSTNVIQNPLLSLITPIGFDHTEHLGNTLIKIASHKAGIIKRNQPCVVSAQVDSVYDLMIDTCYQNDAPCYCYSYDFIAHKLTNELDSNIKYDTKYDAEDNIQNEIKRKMKDNDENNMINYEGDELTNDFAADSSFIEKCFLYKSKNHTLKLPLPSLPGDHQIVNAASVICGVFAINKHFSISLDQIKKGLINTKWPGRIEKVDYQSYSIYARANVKIFLDGAHNVLGADVLADWIKKNLNGPVYMILGLTSNRNVAAFMKPFSGLLTQVHAVTVRSEASSYSGNLLNQLLRNNNFNSVESDSIIDSIIYINQICEHESEVNIVITGSLFLLSDFYKTISYAKYYEHMDYTKLQII